MALILKGILQGAVTVGGGVKKSTGEVIPISHKIQIMDQDERGLTHIHTLTVPSLEPYQDKLNTEISVPVRAWAPNAQVSLVCLG